MEICGGDKSTTILTIDFNKGDFIKITATDKARLVLKFDVLSGYNLTMKTHNEGSKFCICGECENGKSEI